MTESDLNDPSHVGGSLTVVDGVYVASLSRPASANAIDRIATEFLFEVIGRTEQDGDARALILTGAGQKFFCAGGDLREYVGSLDTTGLGAQFARMRSVCEQLSRLRVVTVAAINGIAVGGGVELALSCDLRVMAEDATVRLNQLQLGLAPGWGGHRPLVRAVGPSRALELLVSGRTLGAAEALEIGLVHRVAEDAVESALELAALATAGGLDAYQTVKRFIRDAHLTATDEVITREQEEFLALWPPKSQMIPESIAQKIAVGGRQSGEPEPTGRADLSEPSQSRSRR
ncbi:MAG: enoyl-CoA hydratase/isomerase family protein [Mycolicibacterium sp.]|uniref:enoyl-CoA hydratase/isomerase family protein n=1 Tax=Mycolicibacterium sp. TaxID=2320850 RepID=UPI003D119263